MSGQWAWRTTVPQSLLSDDPALRSFLEREVEGARLAALAEGVQLEGEPTTEMHLLMWVDDWSEDGGALVSPAVAAVAGTEGRPAGAMVLMRWTP